MDPHKDFYSVGEFAKLIGKHPNTIRRAIKSNRISAIRIGDGKRASFRISITEINRVAMVDLEVYINKVIEEKNNQSL